MSEAYLVTGLMSGTSLDGVDLAYCEFTRNESTWDFRILEAETIPYPPLLRKDLDNASDWSMEQVRKLDGTLGEHYAGLLNRFHEKHRCTPALIASHGHTILHEPHKGITFQAGNGAAMAAQTGIPVVNDFRSGDVAQGGQGAPLVPVGDRLLFGEYGACLNLGGFSNISFENQQQKRIAYDVGPANLALNRIAGLEGLTYDEDGKMAGMGMVNQRLLERLNSLEYFRIDPPKSLGKEWFLEVYLPVISQTNLEPTDLMATVVEHIAMQLSAAIGISGAGSVLVTGGGALNRILMERTGQYARARIHIPEIRLVHFKEAMVFGLLGLLRILGEINCLASVTGGRTDLSSGIIHQP